MPTKQSKKAIKEGNCNVIASMEIKNELNLNGLPINNLIYQLIRIRKIFEGFITDQTQQIAHGFENATLDLVQSRTDEMEYEIVANKLDDARVNLELESRDLKESQIKQEVNLVKARLISVLSDANKVGAKISQTPLSSAELNNELNKSLYPDEVRKSLGFVRGPQVDIKLGDETLITGGGQFPLYCPDGDVVNYLGCEIVKITPLGIMFIETIQAGEYLLKLRGETSTIALKVNTQSTDFQLLSFAYSAKIKLDIQVSLGEHVVQGSKIGTLVQILNLEKLNEQVINVWNQVFEKAIMISKLN